jgi:hypothetical protein
MKIMHVLISLIILTGLRLPASETNLVYLEISKATNAQTVIASVPEIESLWPQDPVAYLRTINKAIRVLGAVQENSDATQARLKLFDSMMLKRCPTNAAQASAWVDLKRHIIEYNFNFGNVWNSRSRWLGVAAFIGEIRSRIIPNYRPKGALLDSAGPVPQVVAEQNEGNEEEDRLQTMLHTTNNGLTFHLLHYFARYLSRSGDDLIFINQISDAAHLTPEERAEL